MARSPKSRSSGASGRRAGSKSVGMSPQPSPTAMAAVLPAGPDVAPPRVGMPAVDSVREVIEFTPPPAARAAAAPAAGEPPTARMAESFRIIRTWEVDGYELEPKARGAAAVAAAAARRRRRRPGDLFGGTARKLAKISIADGDLERFGDLRDLIRKLCSDRQMNALRPKIGTGEDDGRVELEERNVQVKAFLYAASREDDNDFHLIIGRDPEASGPEVYMNVEVSGLPPARAESRAQLETARAAYKAFFGRRLPDDRYDFYDPPVRVLVEGSLFWDASHASGQRPGPQSLKSRIPTVWEIHPVTRIVLGRTAHD